MNRLRSSLLPILFLSAATLFAQEPAANPVKLPAALTNRCILLVNAAGLPDDQIESIRAFAQKDLLVKVESIALNADWDSLPAKIPALFTSNRVMVVALGKGTPDAPRILTASDNRWAIVNIAPLSVFKEKYDHMIQQQTMRAIGYAFGLESCLDIYCCMRTSRDLSDLTDVGINFCPLTRKQYRTLAMQKGLYPVSPPRPIVKKPVEKKDEPVPVKP